MPAPADSSQPQPDAIAAMRDWIADAFPADLDPDEIEQLPGDQITAAVARHYTGGIEQFHADTDPHEATR